LRRPTPTGSPGLGSARCWPCHGAEGEAAFEPRCRRPKTSPAAISDTTLELIIRLRKELSGQGLNAGPHTSALHLEHHHQVRVSPATVSRYLTRHGLVIPEPKKRPKSPASGSTPSCPKRCWQSDFIHWHLAGGQETEIVSWIDDHSRYALSVAAQPVITGEVAWPPSAPSATSTASLPRH
jgi:hypothetical protein